MKNSMKKTVGLLLSVLLLMTAVFIPASVTVSATTGNYYVQYGGTGDGRTIGSPARSVKTAIASMNADGLAAGDTANIYILSSSGVTSGSHTLTPWGIAGDPEQTHTAQIVIQGYEGRQWLAYGSGMNSNINLCGPTTFTNLNLFTTRTDHGYIRGYGNNITFGANVKNYKLSGSSTQECHSPYLVMTRNTNNDSAYDVTTAQTLTLASPMIAEGMLFITSENYDNRKHKEDANIVFDNADIGSNGAFKLIFGGTNENTSTHTFEKNLNIDIRNAAKIGFQGNVKTSALDKSDSNQKIKVNGGLQIMTKPGVHFYNIGVADDISAYAAITGVNNIIDTSFWVLTVASADRSKIDFTATAGTYSLSPLYSATATNSSTGATVESVGDSLTVPAGDWSISFARKPATVDYYVQYGGTGDGRTIGSPARSVKTAIASMNADGLTAGDTANIYILSSSGVSSGSHTLTPWGIAGDPEQTHTAQIVIQGYEGRQWLAYGSGMNSNINLCGPTTFNNLNIFTTRTDLGYIRAYGNNVTFGSNMKFYKLDGSSTRECYSPALVMTRHTNSEPEYDVTATQTLTYNFAAAAEGMLYIGSEDYDKRKHTEDANIVLDNEGIGSSGAFKLVFGGTHVNNTTHTFEKNLNIDIRNATKIGFQGNVKTAALDKSDSNQKIKVNGGLQVMTKPGVKFYNIGVADDISAYAAITGVNSIVDTNFWVLTVASADRSKIDFTATAGTYSIKEGYTATATNSSTGATVTSSAGTLTLGAGDWTISFVGFASHSLVLGDRIGINFFMDLSALSASEKTGSYVTFAVTNQDSELRADYRSDFTNSTGAYYGFTCQLSSVQMAEEVVPTFHYGDGKTAVGPGFAVKDYIDFVIENEGSFASEVVDLVKALGDYGHYMQIYLGNKNEWVAGEDYTVLAKYRAADYSAPDFTAYLAELNANNVAMVKNIDGSVVSKVSYNLNFDSSTYINIKLTASESVIASATVDGMTLYASEAGVLRTQGLPIIKLGDAFTLSGTGSTDPTEFSVTLSGLSYIRTILKTNDNAQGAKDAMASLYDYYRAATIYQDSVTGGGNNSNLNGEAVEG